MEEASCCLAFRLGLWRGLWRRHGGGRRRELEIVYLMMIVEASGLRIGCGKRTF